MNMSPGEMYAQQNAAQPPMEQGGASAGDTGDVSENPILDAMRTMMTYVSALNEKGDPRAGVMQQHLAGFVEVLNSSGESATPGGASGGGMPPAPTPQGTAQAPDGGRGMDTMRGTSGGVPSGRGQVAVI